jgi:hypothetical protein
MDKRGPVGLSPEDQALVELELAGLGTHDVPTRYCAEETAKLAAEEASKARQREGDFQPGDVVAPAIGHPAEGEPFSDQFPDQMSTRLNPSQHPPPPRRTRVFLLLAAAVAAAALAVDTHWRVFDDHPPPPSMPPSLVRAPAEPPPVALPPPAATAPSVPVTKGRIPSRLEMVEPAPPTDRRSPGRSSRRTSRRTR